MTGRKPNRTKLFTVLSIIAFTWVILGDLVAMHINVICDINVYSHQPYAKTQKSNEKCIKAKKDDTSTHTFFVDLLFHSEQDSQHVYSDFTKINFLTELDFNFYTIVINSSGRSPPHFII